MRFFSRAVVMGAFLGLAGCGLPGTFWVEPFLDSEFTGSDFNQALARAYQDKAAHESADEVEWIHAGYYAQKGWKAGFDGETVLPWEPSWFGLDNAELVSQRNRLLAALDNGGRDQRAEACAMAQAEYDHWLEEVWENDPEEPEAKETFMTWMAKCEGAAPAMAGPDTFTIYFGFDRDNLTAEAQQVINTIVSSANEMGASSLSVGGFTDTSGSKGYNQGLGQRRANRVSNALSAKGIPSGAISQQSFGESNLAVQTGDGKREPLNRRAIVKINK